MDAELNHRAASAPASQTTSVIVRVKGGLLPIAFQTLGVRRLEAHAAVLNGRGNGALRKIGAVQECVLRRSLALNNASLDQALYAILDNDRLVRRPLRGAGPWFH